MTSRRDSSNSQCYFQELNSQSQYSVVSRAKQFEWRMDKAGCTLSNEPIRHPSTTELWTASLRNLGMLESGPPGSQRLDVLRDRQVVAWERGERLLVEALIADTTPSLSDNELLELIYVQVMLRVERGEVCNADEYVQRFPQFAELLKRLFAIHEALEAHRGAVSACHCFTVWARAA